MEIKNKQSRRAFLRGSTMLAIGVLGTAMDSCKNGDDHDPDPGVCTTTDDILGPFYKSGAPFSENIIPAGVSTSPLIVEGSVLSGCDLPLIDAIVEIWNANEDGVYDMSDEYFFRGSFRTLADGKYRFRTIIPGRYLNGSTFRPSHIHFRITAQGYQELISQIYFQEDPYIPTDPWASSEKARERILPVSTSGEGIDIVNFDIHLSKPR
jgi:catechol 1,2-dioxygenase